MTIKAITDAITNLPIINQIPTLIQRITRVIKNNDDAYQEAGMTAMTVTFGTAMGLLGRGSVMIATKTFSLPSLFFFALIGGSAGVVANTYTLYSFFSNLKAREAGLSN
jgi:hypothetical protein